MTEEQIESELASNCYACDGSKSWGAYWCVLCGGSGRTFSIRQYEKESTPYPYRRLTYHKPPFEEKYQDEFAVCAEALEKKPLVGSSADPTRCAELKVGMVMATIEQIEDELSEKCHICRGTKSWAGFLSEYTVWCRACGGSGLHRTCLFNPTRSYPAISLLSDPPYLENDSDADDGT